MSTAATGRDTGATSEPTAPAAVCDSKVGQPDGGGEGHAPHQVGACRSGPPAVADQHGRAADDQEDR